MSSSRQIASGELKNIQTYEQKLQDIKKRTSESKNVVAAYLKNIKCRTCSSWFPNINDKCIQCTMKKVASRSLNVSQVYNHDDTQNQIQADQNLNSQSFNNSGDKQSISKADRVQLLLKTSKDLSLRNKSVDQQSQQQLPQSRTVESLMDAINLKQEVSKQKVKRNRLAVLFILKNDQDHNIKQHRKIQSKPPTPPNESQAIVSDFVVKDVKKVTHKKSKGSEQQKLAQQNPSSEVMLNMSQTQTNYARKDTNTGSGALAKQSTNLSEFKSMQSIISMPRFSIMSSNLNLIQLQQKLLRDRNNSDSNITFPDISNPLQNSGITEETQKRESRNMQYLNPLTFLTTPPQAKKNNTISPSSLQRIQDKSQSTSVFDLGSMKSELDLIKKAPRQTTFQGGIQNYGKLQFDAITPTIKEEEEEEGKSTRNPKKKEQLQLYYYQQHIMSQGNPAGNRGKHQMGKNSVQDDDQSQVQSIYMKSFMVKKLFSPSDAHKHGTASTPILKTDKLLKLKKDSDSYKQLKAQPVTYKELEERANKQRLESLKEEEELLLESNRSIDATVDGLKHQTTGGEYISKMKYFQPTAKKSNIIKLNLTKSLKQNAHTFSNPVQNQLLHQPNMQVPSSHFEARPSFSTKNVLKRITYQEMMKKMSVSQEKNEKRGN